MRKVLIPFALMTALVFGNTLAADAGKLPPIGSLKDLPVTLVADFMDHDDIASPALPIITKDGTIFFFDQKLHQVQRTHLDNKELKPIGRKGEGPKEYYYARSMLVRDGLLYISDEKQKLLCFDLDGEYKWEKRLGKAYPRIIGKIGASFLIESTVWDEKNLVNAHGGLFLWKDGQKTTMLVSLPKCAGSATAVIGGKRVKGGAVFDIANPAMAICVDTIVTSASKNYTFDLRGLDGASKKTVTLEAPEPEMYKFAERGKGGDGHYAILDIFCHKSYIAIISSYFKNGKPRIDFFSMDGTLVKSYLMPVEIESQSNLSGKFKAAVISNGYLLYKDPDEVGFKVYRIDVD